jgi:hypothetical protein
MGGPACRELEGPSGRRMACAAAAEPLSPRPERPAPPPSPSPPPQGLEAILRVRASNGLDVEGYTGAFYKPPNR